MTASPRSLGIILTILVLGGVLACLSSAPANEMGDASIEVQARGVVHEAYAQPADIQPEPGPMVPKQPPAAITEQPSEYKPKGTNVQWIAGYWAWDADKNDFIWISGTYRDAPAGRKFVPGYWEQSNDGWRWVGGFWAPADQVEMPYVPPPPAPLEKGPAEASPGKDYTYIPGYWIYKEARHEWRTGYYAKIPLGMVWIPPRFVWTPGGCIYISGYWDYPLESRGLLFAPVYFTQPLWTKLDWYWQPKHVVGVEPLLDSLFVDTGICQYRFGDYYENAYVQRGIQPWHVFGAKRFDPLFHYYRRHNPGRLEGLAKLHDARVADKSQRPPRTLAEQLAPNGQGANNRPQMIQAAAQINNASMTKLAAPQVAQQRTLAEHQVAMSQARQKSEAGIAGKGTAGPSRSLNLPHLQQASVAKAGQGKTTTPVVNPSPVVKTPPVSPGTVKPGGQGKVTNDIKQLPPTVKTSSVKTPTVLRGPVSLGSQTKTTVAPPKVVPAAKPVTTVKTTSLPKTGGISKSLPQPPRVVRTTKPVTTVKTTSLPKTGGISKSLAQPPRVSTVSAPRPVVSNVPSTGRTPARISMSRGARGPRGRK